MTYPKSLARRPHSQNLGPKPLVAASLTMILAFLVMDFEDFPNPLLSQQATYQPTDCSQVISDTSRLSRAQLAQLLAIPERDAKERVRQVVSEPYCQLPDLNIRSGVAAEREAYPLAFDPDTTLVILYENNEYAGYRFSFE